MKTAVNKKETGKSLDDTYLDNVNGGINTVNFIHKCEDGKEITTCTLIVEGKEIIGKSGNLRDVPKDIFIKTMTTEDNLKFSKEEAEEIYIKYTV